jgi:hypothetical protein
MSTALSKQEASDLRACEAVIMKGLKTFREVGIALAKIRDAKLYRCEYKSFEAYCSTLWGFGKSQAYRLIEAAGTPEVSPTGEAIETERQARKFLDEQKAKSSTPDADEIAEPVTSGTLAGMDPDPVGVDSDDQPKDRITWLLAQLELMWSDYQAVFADDADWISWRVAQENFAILKGQD